MIEAEGSNATNTQHGVAAVSFPPCSRVTQGRGGLSLRDSDYYHIWTCVL